ncbi:hypothetical protein KI387_007894, partial [Taxus chinensis]
VKDLQNDITTLTGKQKESKELIDGLLQSRDNLTNDLKTSNYELKCDIVAKDCELAVLKEKLCRNSVLFEAVERETVCVKLAVDETHQLLSSKEDEGNVFPLGGRSGTWKHEEQDDEVNVGDSPSKPHEIIGVEHIVGVERFGVCKDYALQNCQGDMKEEENIAAYLLRVDETANMIKGLGEEMEDLVIVQKVLRSLLSRFDVKVSAIEELKDLDLHGILTAYEMRTELDKPRKRESAFKASKGKEKKVESDDESDEEEETLLVKNLKRGSGKYKAKCPHEKSESDDEEPVKAKKGKPFYKKNFKQRKFEKKNWNQNKKSLCTKEDDSSEEDCSEGDIEELLFMTLEDGKVEAEDAVDEEGEVNLEEELICALGEIKRLKKKTVKQKVQFQEYEEAKQNLHADKEHENTIVDLKTQLIQTGSGSSWKQLDLEAAGSGNKLELTGSGNNKLQLETTGFCFRLVFSFILEAFAALLQYMHQCNVCRR